MTETNGISSILIVGGGTAGWMSAIMLNRFLHPNGCQVTLVESTEIETIGVGEATIPSMVKFVRALGFDEEEFMRNCSATYKLGIRFDDWIEKRHSYWHPFGICGGMIEGLDLFHFWLKGRLDGGETLSYSDYSLQARLAELVKAPRGHEGPSPIIDSGSYAYHLDAGALAQYLREIATKEGVQHLFGEVRHVVPDGAGGIERVETSDGRSLEADFFIDCTGFRAKLIEEGLEDPWIDWSDHLLCNRAVAMPLSRDEEMSPFTSATALDAGWMWRIPLSSRTSSGYVYSSAHIDQDTAARELIAHAGFRRDRTADPRFIKLRVGHRTEFWKGNCASVGLSSGFIEPLESTGIFFIQRALELLLEYFPAHGINDVLARRFNQRMTAVLDEVLDFIVLHYILTRRDEPFWRDARNVSLPDTLTEALKLYDEGSRVEAGRFEVFLEPSYYFILSGGERLPKRSHSRTAYFDFHRVREVLGKIRDQNEGFITAMPSHRELIAKIHKASF